MNDAAAKSANGQSAGARPAVLSLSIKEKAALYAAYMPYLKNGGIFVPTTRPYQLGDDVYLILTLLDDSTRIPVAGKVVWVSPAAGRQQDSGHRRALSSRRIGYHRPQTYRGRARRRLEVGASDPHAVTNPASLLRL